MPNKVLKITEIIDEVTPKKIDEVTPKKIILGTTKTNVESIVDWSFNLSEESNNIEELRELLPLIYACNKLVIGPVLNQKIGMEVIKSWKTFWEIQTSQDLQLSELLIDAMSQKYPWTFSEEKDSELRTTENTIYQIDPLDWTWDLKYTLGISDWDNKKITPSTILISKLERENNAQNFKSKASIVFDMINEFAFISDWKEIELYKFNKQWEPQEVKTEVIDYTWKPEDWININRRTAYLQKNYDQFVSSLSKNLWLDINTIPVWWAWTFILHLLKNYIKTEQNVDWFTDLKPLSIWFNAQPDWKTWDTDPASPLLELFWLKEITDIYGEPIKQNASQKDIKKDLVHTEWCVLSTNEEISYILTTEAKKFRDKSKNLLEINY